LRDANERLGVPEHRRKGLWRQLFRHARSSATTSPQRDSGPESSAEAGCSSTAPVSAGRHALRGER
jgi:hypothetical protein